MKTIKQTNKIGKTTTIKTNKKSMAPRAGRPMQSRQLKNYNSEISIQISGNLSFHVFYLFYMGNKFIESLLQKYHTSYGSTIFQTSLTHPLRISYWNLRNTQSQILALTNSVTFAFVLVALFCDFMFFPLDSRNTKKLKKQKLKCWVFINNNRILVKLFQKKPK